MLICPYVAIVPGIVAAVRARNRPRRLAAADSRTPCVGKDAGDSCYASGCRCAQLAAPVCYNDGGTCLSCERSTPAGPGEPCGPGPSGCATSGPVAATLLGFALLVHLALRRARATGRDGSQRTSTRD